MDTIPELSPDIRLEYLAEGGANIVYRIVLPTAEDGILQPSEIPHYGSSTPPPTEIDDTDDIDTDIVNIISGKLLRLRKNVRFGLAYRQTAHDFQTKIRPLFDDEELVDQTMVRVPVSIVQRCNANLQEREHLKIRPLLRCGVYLAEDEPLGMLVTDMTTTTTTMTKTRPAASNIADSGDIVELKPKWLIQSPSAPAGARRCRTCALRDMKRADSPPNLSTSPSPMLPAGAGVVPPGKAQFCPLDLTSTDIKDMQRSIRHIFPSYSPEKVEIVAKALYQHPILLKLLSLQRLHNQVGLHGPRSGSKETNLSMTLRDCSIFVKIPTLVHLGSDIDLQGRIDVRLGDLDLKSAANGKAEYWLNIEKRLIDEGWYTAAQASQIATEGECVLSRAQRR